MAANYDKLVTIVNQSSDEDEEDNEEEKNKRASNREYIYDKTFTTIEKAKEYVTQENTWRYAITKKTLLGKKLFYHCSLGLTRGKQCSTGLYILLPADNLTFEIHKTNCEHDHEEKKQGVKNETRQYIEKIYQLGTKNPKLSLNKLKKKIKRMSLFPYHYPS